MKELTDGDKKLLADIDEVGWHVVGVLTDDEGPGFAYSIGLFKSFGHPEIVIIGLKIDTAHVLINNIGHDIKNGKVFVPGRFYDGILDNFKCLLVDVPKERYEEFFGYGLWYYKSDNFPVLQCIYPTVKGIYPWELAWPDSIRDLQPILGDVTKYELKK